MPEKHADDKVNCFRVQNVNHTIIQSGQKVIVLTRFYIENVITSPD